MPFIEYVSILFETGIYIQIQTNRLFRNTAFTVNVRVFL